MHCAEPLKSARVAEAAVEVGERGVIIRESTWQRLWEKSAIGCPVKDGLSLSDEEVIFCHEQRQFEWPTSDWLTNAVAEDEALLHRGEILVALRAPGNLVVLRQHAKDIPEKHALSNDSWALRWHREKHPSRDEPEAEIRWARSDEKICWNEMQVWSEEVKSRGRIAEFLVIDEEFSVVTYRLESASPGGNSKNPRNLTKDQINNVKSNLKIAKKVPSGGWLSPQAKVGNNGGRVGEINGEFDAETASESSDGTDTEGAEKNTGENQNYWPIPEIGIKLHDGRLLNYEEIQAVCNLTGIEAVLGPNQKRDDAKENSDNSEPDGSPKKPQADSNQMAPLADEEYSIQILQDLFSRGCSVRSGFKYGTKWRVYAGAVGDGHAPWLILPLHAAPMDWAGACLAARLAAGVNKTWCVALTTETNETASQKSIEYLAIRRPPSDSRWSNPHRR